MQSKRFFQKYKPELLAALAWTFIFIILLAIVGTQDRPIMLIAGFFLGFLAIFVSIIFLWRWMKWKALLTIIPLIAVDIDHFLFRSRGFLEHPEIGVKILHAFHSIEMLILVLFLNVFIGMHTFRKGWSSWLFPRKEDYPSKAKYYIAWTVRIIMLGVAIHYLMDIFIYTLGGKWGYYDYSVIHYLLTR